MKLIPLTQGQFAQVDDEDFEYLNQFKWFAHKNRYKFYAMRKVKKGTGKWAPMSMHRILLGLIDPKIYADHKDRNGLNNQRYNLREANGSQNNANKESRKNSSSKYLGVKWYKKHEKWTSAIKLNYKTYHLGYFDLEEMAALAYNTKAVELHGEFANLNII